MYLEHFNLSAKPFELTPDPEFLYLSKGHRRALTYLQYGVRESAGFILVTGEVGTGKTTLLRRLMREVGDDLTVCRITNTRVTSEQLISMINEDFGLSAASKGKTGMLSELTDFLIGEYGRGRRCVLIVDEAQNLTPDLLEEIRLLSNLETEKSKLLQIVMVGQPELRRVLAQPELRQLRQRISVSCHLSPLTRQETEDYFFHRLEVAGNRGAVSFEEGAPDVVYAFCKGIPRLINIVGDYLLVSAFSEELRALTVDFVRDVVAEIETEHRYWTDEGPVPELPASDRSALQEVLKRIGRVEEVCQRALVPRNERAEIIERLTENERLLRTSVERLKGDLLRSEATSTETHARVSMLLKEIEILKQRLLELHRAMPADLQGNGEKKPGFWSRLIS